MLLQLYTGHYFTNKSGLALITISCYSKAERSLGSQTNRNQERSSLCCSYWQQFDYRQRKCFSIYCGPLNHFLGHSMSFILNLPWLHRFHLIQPPRQYLAHPDRHIVKTLWLQYVLLSTGQWILEAETQANIISMLAVFEYILKTNVSLGLVYTSSDASPF